MPRIAALSLCFGLLCAASAGAEQAPPEVQAFLDRLKPLASEEVTLFAVSPNIMTRVAIDAESLPSIACEFRAKAGLAGGRELLRILSDPAPKLDPTPHPVELRIGIFAGGVKFDLDDFGAVRPIGAAPLIYSPATGVAIRRLARSANFAPVDPKSKNCAGSWREMGQ